MDRVRHFFGNRTASWWLAFVWMSLLGVATLVSIFVELENKQNLRERRRPPSFDHLLGTNSQGKDILKLMVDGTARTLMIAAASTLIGILGGSVVGLLLGYWRGRVDQIGVVALDAFASFPTIIGVITLVLFVGNGVGTVIAIIGGLSIPIFARIMRAITLQYVERDFVKASRMVGARHRRVLVRELLPNIAVPVLGYALISVGVIIVIEGGLAYFGVGVPESVNTWGKVIESGRGYLANGETPHISLVAAAVVFVTVLSLNRVSESWTANWGSFGLGGAIRRARRTDAPSVPDAEPFADVPAAGISETADELLTVRNLHTWLETPFGSVRAVDGVDISVRIGQLHALVGESGSGKTMLARSIIGLVPSPPRRRDLPGAILYRGVDLHNAAEDVLTAHRGFHIAMVFQDPMTQLNPVLKVGRQVAEPLQVHLGLSRAAAKARAIDLLTEVGINDPHRRAEQYTHELSGGLRQRVAIAIALAADPAVLIMDEPTSALDVTVQAQILDVLDNLRTTRGLGVLFITHDLGVVANRADEVSVMYGGRIVEHGITADVFAAPRHPYTRALLDAVPRLEGNGHQRLAALAGTPPVLVGPRFGCSFAPRCSRATDECRVRLPELDGAAHSAACFHPLADS